MSIEYINIVSSRNIKLIRHQVAKKYGFTILCSLLLNNKITIFLSDVYAIRSNSRFKKAYFKASIYSKELKKAMW